MKKYAIIPYPLASINPPSITKYNENRVTSFYASDVNFGTAYGYSHINESYLYQTIINNLADWVPTPFTKKFISTTGLVVHCIMNGTVKTDTRGIADQYYSLDNVSATAHLDVGSYTNFTSVMHYYGQDLLAINDVNGNIHVAVIQDGGKGYGEVLYYNNVGGSWSKATTVIDGYALGYYLKLLAIEVSRYDHKPRILVSGRNATSGGSIPVYTIFGSENASPSFSVTSTPNYTESQSTDLNCYPEGDWIVDDEGNEFVAFQEKTLTDYNNWVRVNYKPSSLSASMSFQTYVSPLHLQTTASMNVREIKIVQFLKNNNNIYLFVGHHDRIYRYTIKNKNILVPANQIQLTKKLIFTTNNVDIAWNSHKHECCRLLDGLPDDLIMFSVNFTSSSSRGAIACVGPKKRVM